MSHVYKQQNLNIAKTAHGTNMLPPAVHALNKELKSKDALIIKKLSADIFGDHFGKCKYSRRP